MRKECNQCAYHKEKGRYTSPKLHHCRHCHRSWTGVTQAHCSVCHSHFSSPTAFDKHLVDDTHVRPEQVFDGRGNPVLYMRDDKWGRTWSLGEADAAWWLRQQGHEGSPTGQVSSDQDA